MIELLQVARRVRDLVVSVHPKLAALALPRAHGLGNRNNTHRHALLNQSLLILVNQLRVTLPRVPHILCIREQLAARIAHGGVKNLLRRENTISSLSTPHATPPPLLANQRAAGVAHHVGGHAARIEHLVVDVVGERHGEAHEHHNAARALALLALLHAVARTPRALHTTIAVAVIAVHLLTVFRRAARAVTPRALVATTTVAVVALDSASAVALRALLDVLRVRDGHLDLLVLEELGNGNGDVPRLGRNAVVGTVDALSAVGAALPLGEALLHVGFPLAVVAGPRLNLALTEHVHSIRCRCPCSSLRPFPRRFSC